MRSSISIKMKYWTKSIAAVVEYKNEKSGFLIPSVYHVNRKQIFIL